MFAVALIPSFVSDGRAEAPPAAISLHLAQTESSSPAPPPTGAVPLFLRLADLYRTNGRLDESERLYRRALEDLEARLGPDHPQVARAATGLALIRSIRGDLKEARALHRRALAIRRAAHGPSHGSVAKSLNNLAGLSQETGRLDAAADLLTQALEALQSSAVPDDGAIATVLNNLAVLQSQQGRLAKAESTHRRALAMRRAALGEDHPQSAQSMNSLGNVLRLLGRFAESEAFIAEALAIQRRVLAPDHPDMAVTMTSFALLRAEQGRIGDAEPLLRQVLALRRKALGESHRLVAEAHSNLGLVAQMAGRWLEAESAFRRTLDLLEALPDRDPADFAGAINNLAALTRDQGRYADAEALYRRAIAVWTQSRGADHPDTALATNNLAFLLRDTGDLAEAEKLLRQSHAVRESSLGKTHPLVAQSLNNLADVVRRLERLDEAERLARRSVAMRRAVLGSDNPLLARSLATLARVLADRGRFTEAVTVHRQALDIDTAGLGPEHPVVSRRLDQLAAIHLRSGAAARALPLARRAAGIASGRARRIGGARSAGAQDERRAARDVFVRLVEAIAESSAAGLDHSPDLLDEALRAAQWAHATGTAEAVAAMAARFAAGDDRLAELVRQRQDLIRQRRQRDRAQVTMLASSPTPNDPEAAPARRAAFADLSARLDGLDGLDGQLRREFPRYADMATPRSRTITEIQGLLGPDEGLLAYLVAGGKTYAWLLRRNGARFFSVAAGRQDLVEAIRDLRKGLDPTGIRRIEDLPAVDLTVAHRLYRWLMAPVASSLTGMGHLFIVADGPLYGLPMGLLAREPTASPIREFADYGKVAWLARDLALTLLPDISSLSALRTLSNRAASSAVAMVGFGDPVLGGSSGNARGAVANTAQLRRLAPLPESATELRSLAHIMGSAKSRLYLGAEATERNVKTADLSRTRILAFATHGLVGGQLGGLTEPALVLTPPGSPSEVDDGLLTASEVAQLRLDADIVVLSACNTARPDGTPDAEGLSALVRSFIYAGSRSLVVSHWPVASNAAARLTAGMFRAAASDPGIARSEALKRSMADLMADPEKTYHAHPLFWAPFVVVGEGGLPLR